MSDLLSIKRATLKGIANKVRAKTGKIEDIPVASLEGEIESISTGVDTSTDTVTAEALLDGYTAHDASGNVVTGTHVCKESGSISVVRTIVNSAAAAAGSPSVSLTLSE